MDLFALSARLKLDASQYEQGLEQAHKSAESFGSKMKKVLGAIATAAVVKKTVDGIVNITKAATNAYASYEQLVGGVDTLFKGASKQVQKYADEAYKTAGLSANAYMETVTSFSAAMIQSLGGDTEKAAKLSNQAIIDMADNANKMGSSMESIQNAYQGFAKQNYTINLMSAV